jgi:chemotaxis protein methyltransferase CheR
MSCATHTVDVKSFDFISRFVREKSAIVLDLHKAYLVESRLAPLLNKFELGSIEALVRELQKPTSGELSREVIEAMTTNETSFFRDLHPFNALKDQVLPPLIERRSGQRQLRIWSNACSSGQEPYSIAMLMRESFPALDRWQVEILGTDICSQMLQRCREGTFNQTEVNRGLPMQMLMKYFSRRGTQWVADRALGDCLQFRLLNLIEPWPVLPKMDIVFLWNVLIYFEAETKRQILDKIYRTMHADGYLFLGGAETLMNISKSFRRERIGQATCYRPI